MTKNKIKKKTNKKTEKLLILSVTTFLILLLSSCAEDRRISYAEYADLKVDGWDKFDVLEFYPVPIDSTEAADKDIEYEVAISIRYTRIYPFEDFWIVYEDIDRNGNFKTDSLKIQFVDKNHHWKNAGRNGVCEMIDTIHHNFKLPQNYNITIKHAMKQRIVPGICNVGILLYRTNR